MANDNLSAAEIMVTRDDAANRLLGLNGLDRTPVAFNRACREAKQGDFEALKLLALALCPSLHGINFERFPPNQEPDSMNQTAGNNQSNAMLLDIADTQRFSLLCHAIRGLHRLDNPVWPPGFWSLKKVFIDEDLNSTIDYCSFAPMLLLPNVESINVATFFPPLPTNLKTLQQLIPCGTSSVQHLSFSGKVTDSIEFITIYALSAWRLKTLMVNRRHRLQDILEPLKASKTPSLERVVLYRSDNGAQASTRWLPRSSFVTDLLPCFGNMRVLTINLLDIMQTWKKAQSADWGHDFCTRPIPIDCSYIQFVQSVIASIPRSIRNLILVASTGRFCFAEDLAIVDDAFCRIIEEHQCANLKAIYLDSLRGLAIIPGNGSRQSYLEKGCLPRTVTRARTLGISIYDITNVDVTNRFVSKLNDELFRV